MKVGKLVRFAALNVGAAVKPGAAVEPVKFPNTVCAAAVAAPVPPFAIATVPVTFPALPLVLKLPVPVMFVTATVGAVHHEGCAAEPLALHNTL